MHLHPLPNHMDILTGPNVANWSSNLDGFLWVRIYHCYLGLAGHATEYGLAHIR